MEAAAGSGAPLGWAGLSSGALGREQRWRGWGNPEEGVGKPANWKEENRIVRKGDWVILGNEQPVWARYREGPRLRDVSSCRAGSQGCAGRPERVSLSLLPRSSMILGNLLNPFLSLEDGDPYRALNSVCSTGSLALGRIMPRLVPSPWEGPQETWGTQGGGGGLG